MALKNIKKGQLSLFVIIGLLVVVVFGFIVYLQSQDDSTGVEVTRVANIPKEMLPVKDYFDACAIETGNEGLLLVGLQGGFDTPALFSFASEYGRVPYFYYLGEDMRNTKEDFRQSFLDYMELNMDLCLDGFSSLSEQGYEVEFDPEYYANLKEDYVQFGTSDRIKVTKNGVEQYFNLPEYKFGARIGDVYKVVDGLYEEIMENPKFVNIENSFELMEQYGLQIDTMNNEGITIYVVRDEENKLFNVPFTFLFAVLYDSTNSAPIIRTDEIEMEANTIYMGYLDVFDFDYDAIEYYTDSFLEIDKYSGQIRYTPTVDDIGEHTVLFVVNDGTDYASKEVKVMIK